MKLLSSLAENFLTYRKGKGEVAVENHQQDFLLPDGICVHQSFEAKISKESSCSVTIKTPDPQAPSTSDVLPV